jgi:UDP-glucose 4-epimerase
MYSRGSVIPLFVEQLRAGRPLTLTEPKMTRFLMTLNDSVELVQHAFTNSTPGDLFVRKAPASTVQDLALALAGIFGVEPDLRIIGTRHGEKLYETLLSREEMAKAEDLEDYYRVPLDIRSLDYALYVEEGDSEQSDYDDYTSQNTERLDVPGVTQMLRTLAEVNDALGHQIQ